MIAPLAKSGAISASTNLWLAIPIGIVFGYALFHAGFTDSRRIAWAFYFKDVGVPVVMFSAIATGMLGLWGLSALGVLDISRVYMLPTFLWPMAIGGLIFLNGRRTGSVNWKTRGMTGCRERAPTQLRITAAMIRKK